MKNIEQRTMPLTADEIIEKARRIQKEKKLAEQKRLEAEKLQREQKEREEAERLRREQEERERKEAEERARVEKERAEPEHFETEWLPREKKENNETGISSNFVKIPGGTVVGKEYKDNVIFAGGVTLFFGSFYIAKYETTQEDYKKVMKGQSVSLNGRTYILNAEPSNSKGEKLPVVNVSWYDAVYYCNALSEQEKLSKSYDIKIKEIDENNHIVNAEVKLIANAYGYRLPKEAEWEYAARGGNPEAAEWNYKYSGSSNFNKIGWFKENSDNSKHQVGQKQPNSLGLYDMNGNVFEWCDDKNDDGNFICRGGSYKSNAAGYDMSYRNYSDSYYPSIGFRLARNADHCGAEASEAEKRQREQKEREEAEHLRSEQEKREQHNEILESITTELASLKKEIEGFSL